MNPTESILETLWWSKTKSTSPHLSQEEQIQTSSQPSLYYSSTINKQKKEHVLSKVLINGLDLKYASHGMPPAGVSLRDDTLQNDHDVVLAAVTQNGRALEYGTFLKNDCFKVSLPIKYLY